MPKLSYLILHYNRPYLLETCIYLVRKYGPKDMELIVADDGSDPEIVKAIKKMPIDNIFVQSKNKNTTSKGSCSNTIASGRKMCKGEYFLFSEDDFFLSGCPFSSNIKHLKNEEIMPRATFGSAKYNIIEKSMELLKNNPEIKNVQLARDPNRVPVVGELVVDKLKWHYVNHKIKKGCYYCNWPNLSRIEDHRKYKIHANLAIWSLEGAMAGGFDKVHGYGNWAIVPERRYYWHVGTAFSKRLSSFSKAKKRQASSEHIQSLALQKTKTVDMEDFSHFLSENWKNKIFYLDNEELVQKGLNEAFTSSFERLRNHGKN